MLDFKARLHLSHSKVCSAVQYFKFVASNPISIKTKVRAAVCMPRQALPDSLSSCSVLQRCSPCTGGAMLAHICSLSGAELTLCSQHCIDTAASLQTRSVNNDMFLEACVENATKGPLVLEYMKFAATPPLTSTPVDTKRDLNVHQTEQGPLQQYMDTLQVGAHS